MAQPDAQLTDVDADVALRAGSTLCDGQFTLTQQIGAGGFGITYKATDNVLGRPVVIKECFPEDFCMRHGINVVPRNQQHAAQFQSIVAMFMREARSLAKLRHPHIVGVHRAFEENNTAYMVLDLIEGDDLLDEMEIKPKTLTPDRVQDLLLKLLDAVETVHNMDLLHRDIAPDNIMIDKDGTPVLIDFGAARGDASRKTRAISSLLVVKDGYSPPEFYVAGSAQMPNSDLFALGATFYHLLTGKAPPNSQLRIAEVAGNNDDPCKPLKGQVKGYPPAFLDAIDHAMKITPSDRLQSAAAWRDMLAGQAKKPTAKATSKPAKPLETNADLSAILGRPLTELIEETNVVVSKTRIIEETAPPVVEAPKPAPKVPDWVEEFNKETAGEDVPADIDHADTDTPTPSRPVQARRVRTRVSEGSTERRSSGWAMDAIQKRERVREERAKSDGISVNPVETPDAPAHEDPPAVIAAQHEGGWVKPVVRMSLMGIFFGILVFVATSAVMSGGA